MSLAPLRSRKTGSSCALGYESHLVEVDGYTNLDHPLGVLAGGDIRPSGAPHGYRSEKIRPTLLSSVFQHYILVITSLIPPMSGTQV